MTDIQLGKFDYFSIPDLLRNKYDAAGKKAQTLVSCKELENGDISYKVFKKLALKVVFKSTFTRLMIKNYILKESDIYLGSNFLHPVGGSPDMQALDLERGDNIASYIYSFLDAAVKTHTQ